MKALLAAAALLLVTSTAQAQYTFEYGGRTIRVDPDRGYVSIPGVYDNTPRRERRARSNPEDGKPPKKDARKSKDKDQDQPAPDTAATPIERPVEPGMKPTETPAAAPATTTATAPADAAPAPAATSPAPETKTAATSTETAAVERITRDLKPTAIQPKGPSPLGLWLTEEKEGMIRIEACGDNLCGYAVDRKSQKNGDLVLFDMKPANDKWNGKIVDPSNGSTYESWIALRSQDALRIQGCAFGAMFCGGQTWTRVN